MIVSFEFKDDDFFKATANLQALFSDMRPYWAYLQSTGEMSKIQNEWFRSGGPDGSKLSAVTVKQRRAGLLRTERKSENFYLANRAGQTDKPSGSIRANSPKWMWTKNTLRSTYLSGIATANALVFDTGKFKKILQSSSYNRFGGPFTHQLAPNKIWDLPKISNLISSSLGRYVISIMRGQYNPQKGGLSFG